MTAEWSAVASSRVERWIAAAVVHSLCSLVEREHPRAAEWSGRSCQEEEEEEEEEEVEADWEEEEEVGCSTRNTESLAELLRDQLWHLTTGK